MIENMTIAMKQRSKRKRPIVLGSERAEVLIRRRKLDRAVNAAVKALWGDVTPKTVTRQLSAETTVRPRAWRNWRDPSKLKSRTTTRRIVADLSDVIAWEIADLQRRISDLEAARGKLREVKALGDDLRLYDAERFPVSHEFDAPLREIDRAIDRELF